MKVELNEPISNLSLISIRWFVCRPTFSPFKNPIENGEKKIQPRETSPWSTQERLKKWAIHEDSSNAAGIIILFLTLCWTIWTDIYHTTGQ